MTTRTLRHYATVFLKHRDAMGPLTFSDMVALQKTERVVADAERFLEAILIVCMEWHPEEEALQTVYVRIFLMAYLVHLHPGQTFFSRIPEAIAVIEASNALVEKTDELIDLITRGCSVERLFVKTKGFVDKIAALQHTYFAWQKIDDFRVMNRLKRDLEWFLTAMLHATPDYREINYDDPVIVLLKSAMDELIGRLVEIAGIHEIYTFNRFMEKIMEERRYLRMLREEQLRYHVEFDLIQPF